METISQQLAHLFHQAISSVFPDLDDIDSFLEITQSTQEKFGHYQCNSAMRLGKRYQQPPRTVAENICKALSNEATQIIEKTEIAGPGFINITLSTKALEDRLLHILTDPHLGIDKPTHKQRIVIDFSSPNTAKQLHVGHLRSSIIGDCLARLFEFLGHDVLRLNHIGDWGTPFGILIAYMKRFYPKVLKGEEETDLSHLATWYKESRKLFDHDEAFKKDSQLEVVRLQGGDPETLKAWHIICDISQRAFLEIYDLLDISIQERGESFYNPYLPKLIQYLESKKVIEISDGAKCIFLEEFQSRDGKLLPMIVQKSDGGYNYSSTDMAALKQRIEEEKADRIIYVTDAGQALHFKMLFAAAQKAGFYDPNQVQIDHVTFGLVLGDDGKKLKTRSGESEKLIDLLQGAITKARHIIHQRTTDLTKQEEKELAHVLGIGAIKYADLSCLRTKDYIFSYDRMLKFEGNTAPFLLYAYVRINGIKRKLELTSINITSEDKLVISHPSEIALALHIAQFAEVLQSLEKDLLPNRLTEYLYNLAEKFHAFFRDCKVIDSDYERPRLLLCETCAKVLKQGLDILGLQVVEKM